MSSVRSSPERTSGASRQNVAVSISARSRTTSHLSLASARRWSPACCEPTAGFWPITNMPVEAAVERAQHRREVGVVAGDLRQAAEAVVVLAVAASPNHAFSSETMYLSKFDHQPRSAPPVPTYSSSVSSPSRALGMCR